MLQVARLAPNLLQEAADRVVEFLHEQFNPDGGARDRAGKSDLYYTVFALEGLIALRKDLPVDRVRPWLETFGDGDGLDLVHLSSLARCWAALPKGSLEPGRAKRLAERIETHRPYGPVYHVFLALGALQDLAVSPGDPDTLRRSIESAGLPDGSFANGAGGRVGTTTTTAAAVTVLRHLGAPVPPSSSEWILARARAEGGFLATKGAPLPDLLSTATALHALSGMQTSFAGIKEATLDFIDTLWTGRAFCGTWADEAPDSEYTYYALLSLGHLSLD